MDQDRLQRLRREYGTSTLDVADVRSDPVEQFEVWMAEALIAEVDEPNAMVLSTAAADGRPSGRTVLLKGLDERGFVFFTNYESRKATDLEANPVASLCFLWLPLHRQVRVEGGVERLTEAESDAYFGTRPRDARIGARASPQSRVIPGREWLEERFAEEAARHAGADPPRPSFWGGYRVRPEVVELWQGRQNRLHDRVRYRQVGTGWSVERLAP